jgi:hypothetical protein
MAPVRPTYLEQGIGDMAQGAGAHRGFGAGGAGLDKGESSDGGGKVNWP